jgi:hypothetical protein
MPARHIRVRSERKEKAPAGQRALSNSLILDRLPGQKGFQPFDPPDVQPSPSSHPQNPRPAFTFFIFVTPFLPYCDSAGVGILTLIVMVSKQVTIMTRQVFGSE